MTMKEIGAAEFKERCLSILDEVDEDGLVITKRGKPVAKLIPIRAESSALIGALAGKLAIRGEILSTGAAWDAQP
jgi:prevent-host-death family protein